MSLRNGAARLSKPRMICTWCWQVRNANIVSVGGGGRTFVSDGGWDHNPHSGEVQLALSLDHLDRECTFTMLVVRAARMLSWNDAESLNTAEIRAT